ncbi:MAG: hypothetical protein K5694_00440, partial [Bacilli bacterium]|nr:hypothetical protein [Bacilli bacterium]
MIITDSARDRLLSYFKAQGKDCFLVKTIHEEGKEGLTVDIDLVMQADQPRVVVMNQIPVAINEEDEVTFEEITLDTKGKGLAFILPRPEGGCCCHG